MKKKQIVGLVIAVGLFIITGVTSVLTNSVAENKLSETVGKVLTGGYEFNAPYSDYVAVVKVNGTIQQQTTNAVDFLDTTEQYKHTTTLEYIDYLMSDLHNVGILLYVDSPGGNVYESEELYLKLMEYKEATQRPVWGYMAHYAASGGYYVSMPADYICANPGTVTGSIGVIMSGYDMTGLYEKLGIEYISVTSGENKDSSQMTEEQIAIYQSQVDEFFNRFVEIVADGRQMSEEEVRALADGRTYTAKQAMEHGLIDEVGLYEDVKTKMSSELGTTVFYEIKSPASTLSSLLRQVEQVVPKSEAQILTEIAKEKENGGLMYYAEQLQ